MYSFGPSAFSVNVRLRVTSHRSRSLGEEWGAGTALFSPSPLLSPASFPPPPTPYPSHICTSGCRLLCLISFRLRWISLSHLSSHLPFSISHTLHSSVSFSPSLPPSRVLAIRDLSGSLIAALARRSAGPSIDGSCLLLVRRLCAGRSVGPCSFLQQTASVASRVAAVARATRVAAVARARARCPRFRRCSFSRARTHAHTHTHTRAVAHARARPHAHVHAIASRYRTATR